MLSAPLSPIPFTVMCELMVMNGVFDDTHFRCPVFEETCLIEELLQCSQHHCLQFY